MEVWNGRWYWQSTASTVALEHTVPCVVAPDCCIAVHLRADLLSVHVSSSILNQQSMAWRCDCRVAHPWYVYHTQALITARHSMPYAYRTGSGQQLMLKSWETADGAGTGRLKRRRRVGGRGRTDVPSSVLTASLPTYTVVSWRGDRAHQLSRSLMACVDGLDRGFLSSFDAKWRTKDVPLPSERARRPETTRG